jgi:ubiquinone/menaquinone biosynthesis C-methylase UbiE
MESLSFDRLVELYDETRVFDQECFDAALDFISGRYPPKIFSRVFEPGIGTGRIAIPLAERGYLLTGVDISPVMLGHLKRKLEQNKLTSKVLYRQADTTSLPFPDEVFDLAIVVHLFYFIKEWKLAAKEILRVVRAGCPVILMHTGNGMEVPWLNDRYKELCGHKGYSIPTVGVKSTGEVLEYLKGIGCLIESIRGRWQWTAHIRMDRTLGHMRDRSYSQTISVPEDIHVAVIQKLEDEIKENFGSLDAEADIPNEIYLAIIVSPKKATTK